MDEPIFYTHAIPSVSPDKPPKELYDYLEFALVNDNKEEFLRLINEPDFFGYGVDRLLGFDCPKIATALINGEATCINDDDDDDLLLFKGGWSPMHLACFGPSPRLIQDLIGRGFPVDVRCDYAPLHFERVTPLDLALEFIDTGYKYGYRTIDRPWTPNCSIFELLHYVCNWQRSRLEVIRLLVKNTKNKDLVRRAFFDYGAEKKLIKLTALFLAVPELFLPSSLESHGVIDQLYHHLESLPKNDIQDGILLLLDVFYLVGHKLVAYIRVYESKDWLRAIFYGEIKIGFFLGEVVRKLERKKPGSSSLDGYLLRFFMPVSQLDYPRRLYYMKQTATCGMFSWNLFEREDSIDINYVNRMISRLVPHEEDVLKKAINDKLSVMLTIRTVFKDMRKQFRSRKRRRIELMRVDPFCTKVANANVFPVMVGKSLAMNPT